MAAKKKKTTAKKAKVTKKAKKKPGPKGPHANKPENLLNLMRDTQAEDKAQERAVTVAGSVEHCHHLIKELAERIKCVTFVQGTNVAAKKKPAPGDDLARNALSTMRQDLERAKALANTICRSVHTALNNLPK